MSGNSKRVNCLKEGWLSKKGKNVKNWKKRYFVIEQNSHFTIGAVIYYYEDESKTVKKGKIDLKMVVDIQNRSPPYKTPIFEIQTISRNYLLQADSDIDKEDWLSHLSSLKGNEIKGSSSSRYGLVKEGNLNKMGEVVKKWKTRQFCLYSNPAQITYAKASNASFTKGCIDILEINDIKEGEEGAFELQTNYRNFTLKADSNEEMRDWIRSIITIAQQVRNDSNFKSELYQSYENLNQRSSIRNSYIKQGWMRKRGEIGIKNWQKRYFILQSLPDRCVLKYFDGPDSGVPNGVIEINQVQSLDRDGRFFNVVIPGRSFEIRAKTEFDAIDWCAKINRYLPK